MLSKRQESFALYLSQGITKTQSARQAGYSLRSARVQGQQLAALPQIVKRVTELQAMSSSVAVMPVVERKERLTTFAREDILSEKGSLIRGSCIEALKELNKMDNVYVRQPTREGDRVINILVTDSETGRILTRLMSGERREGEKADE